VEITLEKVSSMTDICGARTGAYSVIGVTKDAGCRMLYSGRLCTI
jgi:hypothetical protein